MNTKLTITIGIPAYNEEANIANILTDILRQQSASPITSIIISSDASTDKTESIVASLKNKKIQLLKNKTRKGIARGLNQIIRKATGDILVFLDADIRLSDRHFIAKLIDPIIKNKADLTSSAIKPIKSKTFFSQTLSVSMMYKTALFQNIHKGNNIYTCYGLARGLSRRFYKKLHFPVSIGNDMYSYLSCLKNKFIFQYVPQAVAKYRLPDNFTDHQKQSTRFLATENQQKELFDANFVKKETKIPFEAILGIAVQIARILIKYPIETICYCIVVAQIKFIKKTYSGNQTWDIAISSKSV